MSKNKTGLSIHHTRLAKRLGLENEFFKAMNRAMSVKDLAKMVNTPLKNRGVEPAALGNGVMRKS